eukprot:5239126-Pyramimonas_sp.AAC.1
MELGVIWSSSWIGTAMKNGGPSSCDLSCRPAQLMEAPLVRVAGVRSQLLGLSDVVHAPLSDAEEAFGHVQ